MKPSDFPDLFLRLTEFAPFPWQTRLFRNFVDGNFEDCATCRLPTGLGKTSVLPIWLVALAINPTKVPRRLVYVVNRRTVVDQTTVEAEAIRKRLSSVPELEQALIKLCSVTEPFDRGPFCPLAISTLRGQFADNREWSSDPCRPAIISGTVDMIGSRLLFDGYRCGFKSKPMHAGFLATDALLIHDEAHLEPAFQSLIESISREQIGGRFPEMDRNRTLKVIELSATTRLGGRNNPVFTLGDEDRQHPEIAKRISATKRITLHRVEKENELANRIAELAKKHAQSNQAILVFVRKVTDVKKVVDALRKEQARNQPNNIAQLTGTIRGYERDQLATANPVFQRFLPEKSRSEDTLPLEGTVFLVATSAGEVGVNVSADHMVGDLSTFESLAQRLGRVNRFGTGEAQVDLVASDSMTQAKDKLLKPMELSIKRTWRLLNQLPQENGTHDGSSTALEQLPEHDRLCAFSPQPEILHVDEMLFDAWAMTTLSMPSIKDDVPGQPAIADWLHGVTEYEAPRTQVAWRREVDLLTDKFMSDQLRTLTRESFLEAYPVKPHELLSDRSDRVFDSLKTVVEEYIKRHRDKTSKPKLNVWVVNRQGKVTVQNLGDIANPDAKANDRKRLEAALHHQTIVLPESLGGLDANGMFVGKFHDDVQHDVADALRDEAGRLLRWRYRSDSKLSDEIASDVKRMRTALKASSSTEKEDTDDDAAFMYWCVARRDVDDDSLSYASSEQQMLQPHLDTAELFAEGLTSALGLPENLSKAVAIAAKYHDLGKRRKLWQRGIGNADYDPADASTAWAKSGAYSPPINRYRHEFGSLADIWSQVDFVPLEPESQELVLHLIAAHHGRARPHFPTDEAFDPEAIEEESLAIATQTPIRFSRLQRRFGRWQLAWLESLVRAADYLASQSVINENSQVPAARPIK